MREILFRGKSLKDKWVCGRYWYNSFGDHFIKTEKHGSHMVDISVDPETVSQYIGLKDKNGNKIFEGDIIKNIKGEIGTVLWVDGFSSFSVFNKTFKDAYFLLGFRFGGVEIIGNIHDNPELLEKC